MADPWRVRTTMTAMKLQTRRRDTQAWREGGVPRVDRGAQGEAQSREADGLSQAIVKTVILQAHTAEQDKRGRHSRADFAWSARGLLRHAKIETLCRRVR
jgi:hypothetical protein